MFAEPAVAIIDVALQADKGTRDFIVTYARGRPLVVDYFAARLRGFAIGDLTTEFVSADLQPCYVELRPIGDVRLLVHRRLASLVVYGARLERRWSLFGAGLRTFLRRPELWMEFLIRNPAPRRPPS